MTSSPTSCPEDRDEGEAGLAGFRSSTVRGVSGAGGWLLALLTALLLLPVGAWVVPTVDTGDDPAATGADAQSLPTSGERAELREQAIMLVVSTTCPQGARCGSGFALEVGGDVVVVTNRHVVEGACTTTLRPLGGGEEVAVREVRLAAEADVAVLVLDEAVQPVPLASGSEIMLGEDVEVVGFPWGEPTVLSGYARRIEPGRLVLAMEADHGASGSPVLDASGAVIGQLFARLEDEECCVAMPIDDVVAAALAAEPVVVCP